MNIGLTHVFIIPLFIIIKSIKVLQQHSPQPVGCDVNPASRILSLRRILFSQKQNFIGADLPESAC